MIEKIRVDGNVVRISKELCSEIIPPRTLMRALMKEYDDELVFAIINRFYGLPFKKIAIMHLELNLEKEKKGHGGRPSVLTDAQRAFIEKNMGKTGREIYEFLRANMGYTGSLKTVQNELTKIRNKHRIDF